MAGGGTTARGFLIFLGVAFLLLLWDAGELVRLQQYVQSKVSVVSNWGTHFTSCSSKPSSPGVFLPSDFTQRHHRHGRNHRHPNGFHEELQVLGSESRSWHVIDTPDILSAWSSADLRDVAWLATVEANTTMRVSLHWVGAI